MYGIERKAVDEYSFRSQQRWGKANDGGLFKSEIVPVEIKTRKGVESFEVDEHPRPATSMEQLAKLRPVFIKDTGLVTAGNASGISDGAASIIVAGEDAVKKNGLKPLARVVDWFYVGCEPTIMGIGPVPAIQGVLARTGLKIEDFSHIEINEAFAAQILAVSKELGIDAATINPHGGAIALGHPLGASGARILSHMTYELIRTGGKYALGAACIGGGQGIAVVLERV
jgi:acetyl-CoA acyltransferase 2